MVLRQVKPGIVSEIVEVDIEDLPKGPAPNWLVELLGPDEVVLRQEYVHIPLYETCNVVFPTEKDETLSVHRVRITLLYCDRPIEFASERRIYPLEACGGGNITVVDVGKLAFSI